MVFLGLHEDDSRATDHVPINAGNISPNSLTSFQYAYLVSIEITDWPVVLILTSIVLLADKKVQVCSGLFADIESVFLAETN